MKLKGITKLVLAGTALAATAATLTTATYAWYVTNAEVDATGVSGSVASTSTGSLYIAKNKVASTKDLPDVYRTELALQKAAPAVSPATGWNQTDIAAGKYTFDDLIPQSKTADAVYGYTRVYAYDSGVSQYYVVNGTSGAYEPAQTAPTSNTDFTAQAYYTKSTDPIAAANDWVDDKGKTTTGTFITFKFWLKSINGGQVDVILTVDNTTAGSFTGTQKAMDETSLPTGIANGQAFAVDAVHALRMSVKQTEYDATTSAATVTYKQATGTFVAGTTYYTDNTGATAVDTSTFDENTDVSTYYVVDTVTPGTTSYEVATDATTHEPKVTTETYQVDKVAVGVNGLAYSTANTTAVKTNGLTFAEGGDANKYYNALTGLKPFGTGVDGKSTDTNTGVTTWGSINLGVNKDTLLEFNVWLEGSDADCWDSCRGQAFTFDFNFKLHTA